MKCLQNRALQLVKDNIKMIYKKILKIEETGPEDAHLYKYVLAMPEFLAEWDVWDYWEKERLLSMQDNLKMGDVLFDIGAESGWMAAIFAKYMVGGENMVLFEPTPDFWPNIKNLWDANNLKMPKATFMGLVGNGKYEKSLEQGEEAVKDTIGVWPEGIDLTEMTQAKPYYYLHNEAQLNNSKVISIDTFCGLTGIYPDAVTIDVEGAEFEVLNGMLHVLKKVKKVWVSIHEDLMKRDHNTSPEDIFKLMEYRGFKKKHLATDHEAHYFFYK